MAGKKIRGSEPEIPVSIDPETGIQLLERQIAKARELLSNRPLSTSDHTAWNNTTRDCLIRTFGSASPNVNAVLYASSDYGLQMGMGDKAFEQYEASQLSNQVKMLESCIEQLHIDIELSKKNTKREEADVQPHTPTSNRVFIVHGRNDGLKETVARFLEKLDLDPVILHEKPNAGRTIIEKFSDYADVYFAVVLLTGDDEGRLKQTSDELKARARQNVILELGYFLGKLGRARVCPLYESGVEIPNDYQGVLFAPIDTTEKWRVDLVQELKAAGFNVDANKIFSAD